MGLTVMERKKLTIETAKTYCQAVKHEKTAILNVFCNQTELNRKYAIFILNKTAQVRTHWYNGKYIETVHIEKPTRKKRKKNTYKRKYDEKFTESLKKIWEFFDYKCGQLLVPFIRENIESIRKEKLFSLTDENAEKLKSVSSATIDRLLAPTRKQYAIKGISTTKATSNLNSLIPIRTYFSWDERLPGFFEADTVAHCGTSSSGQFISTLTVTDVCTGWTELRPLKNKAAHWVENALTDIKSSLPFEMKGIDSDNGEEFKNWQIKQWCDNAGVCFTRSRPYRKNDNCFVEQKNGSLVRSIAGYYRYEGDETLTLMRELYRCWCALTNCFYPSLRLRKKERKNSKVFKQYDKAETPFSRLMKRDDITVEQKNRLQSMKNSYDLIALRKQIGKLQFALYEKAVPQKNISQWLDSLYDLQESFG